MRLSGVSQWGRVSSHNGLPLKPTDTTSEGPSQQVPPLALFLLCHAVQHLIISSNVGSCHTHLCRKAHFLNTYQMFNKYLLGKRDRNSNLYSHVIPGKHLRVSKRTIHSDHCESPLSSQTRKHRDIQEKYTATSHWRNFKFSSSHILKRKRK